MAEDSRFENIDQSPKPPLNPDNALTAADFRDISGVGLIDDGSGDETFVPQSDVHHMTESETAHFHQLLGHGIRLDVAVENILVDRV